jgi:hypothetical protein
MKDHISQNFDNSPFSEDVEVSMLMPLTGQRQGYSASYLVTFTGVSFSNKTEELFEVSHRFPWFDDFCSSSLIQDSSLDINVSIETLMNSTSLEPGRSYYVNIAAQNNFGFGPSASSSPLHVKPKSSPALAQECKVEWKPVYPFTGEAPSHYRVEVYMNSSLVSTKDVVNDDTITTYSTIISGLNPGALYEVVVVPVSDMGEGGPFWFSDIDLSSGAFVGNYRDYLTR